MFWKFFIYGFHKSIAAVKPFFNKTCLIAVLIISVMEFGCVPAIAMNAESREGLVIRHKQDRLDVQIENKPLKQVMDELRRVTGTKVVFDDPSIAELPVSASANAVSLRKAVKIILKGFSYAVYQETKSATVIVLSNPPNPGIVGALNEQAGAQSRKSFEVTQIVTSSQRGSDPAWTPEQVPQNLEDFQPLRVGQDSGGFMGPDHDAPDPVQEPEYHEALLHRALDALSSHHQHLRAEAIDQLAGLQDPRAADALIAAADDESLRFSAIEALGRHSTNQGYAQVSSITALQRFTEDNDPTVRSLAEQALEQLDRHQLSDLGE